MSIEIVAIFSDSVKDFDRLVRLSVGLEEPADLIEDFAQALRKSDTLS